MQQLKRQLFEKKQIRQILSDSLIHDEKAPKLERTLGQWDLFLMGIAAIIGSGIFSTIGNAAYFAGPAVIWLFVFTGLACTFSALCYAEFASAIPVSGSAYTYTYAAFGELAAWIIGWNLLMEYAISNIIVAISWSQYFEDVANKFGFRIPSYWMMDFMSAFRGLDEPSQRAWLEAPRFFGIPVVFNLPVVLITLFITYLTYIGIKKSKVVSNALVLMKVAVIVMIIAIGFGYVNTANWTPFAPNGLSGVLRGISSVFFAYIGFDAISTTAEECRDPQKDLPRAMIYSISFSTLLYIIVALVLTGMVGHQNLAIADPLAFVFSEQGANIPWIGNIISVIGVIALAAVLLIYQLGQPRIWMAMSRDGLLPEVFASIHSKYQTPWFSTLVTGAFVIIPSLFMNLTEVADLTSMGTLLAFSMVCAGCLETKNQTWAINRKFKLPFIKSRYFYPLVLILGVTALGVLCGPMEFLHEADHFANIPRICFLVMVGFFVILGCFRELSLIPLLGITCNGYLISELGISNWIRFALWLMIGLAVYFLYGVRHSKMKSPPLPRAVLSNSKY